MNLSVLSLNCQKAYNPAIREFLIKNLQSNRYDFLLLQEADEKVLSIIEEVGSYKILKATNPHIERQSHLCILYKNEFALTNTDFVSFSKISRWFAHRPEFGLLLGEFEHNGNSLVIASTHLRPGFRFYLRAKETRIIKDKLGSCNPELPIIFGGDFNLTYPWETAHTRKIFSPGFIDASISIGPTLDSQYTEKGTHLASKINDMLKVLGISIKFKTDRIFTNKHTVQKYSLNSTVLPDRVSDHSPVELLIS